MASSNSTVLILNRSNPHAMLAESIEVAVPATGLMMIAQAKKYIRRAFRKINHTFPDPPSASVPTLPIIVNTDSDSIANSQTNSTMSQVTVAAANGNTVSITYSIAGFHIPIIGTIVVTAEQVGSYLQNFWGLVLAPLLNTLVEWLKSNVYYGWFAGLFSQASRTAEVNVLNAGLISGRQDIDDMQVLVDRDLSTQVPNAPKDYTHYRFKVFQRISSEKAKVALQIYLEDSVHYGTLSTPSSSSAHSQLTAVLRSSGSPRVEHMEQPPTMVIPVDIQAPVHVTLDEQVAVESATPARTSTSPMDRLLTRSAASSAVVTDSASFTSRRCSDTIIQKTTNTARAILGAMQNKMLANNIKTNIEVRQVNPTQTLITKPVATNAVATNTICLKRKKSSSNALQKLQLISIFSTNNVEIPIPKIQDPHPIKILKAPPVNPITKVNQYTRVNAEERTIIKSQTTIVPVPVLQLYTENRQSLLDASGLKFKPLVPTPRITLDPYRSDLLYRGVPMSKGDEDMCERLNLVGARNIKDLEAMNTRRSVKWAFDLDKAIKAEWNPQKSNWTCAYVPQVVDTKRKGKDTSEILARVSPPLIKTASMETIDSCAVYTPSDASAARRPPNQQNNIKFQSGFEVPTRFELVVTQATPKISAQDDENDIYAECHKPTKLDKGKGKAKDDTTDLNNRLGYGLPVSPPETDESTESGGYQHNITHRGNTDVGEGSSRCPPTIEPFTSIDHNGFPLLPPPCPDYGRSNNDCFRKAYAGLEREKECLLPLPLPGLTSAYHKFFDSVGNYKQPDANPPLDCQGRLTGNGCCDRPHDQNPIGFQNHNTTVKGGIALGLEAIQRGDMGGRRFATVNVPDEANPFRDPAPVKGEKPYEAVVFKNPFAPTQRVKFEPYDNISPRGFVNESPWSSVDTDASFYQSDADNWVTADPSPNVVDATQPMQIPITYPKIDFERNKVNKGVTVAPRRPAPPPPSCQVRLPQVAVTQGFNGPQKVLHPSPKPPIACPQLQNFNTQTILTTLAPNPTTNLGHPIDCTTEVTNVRTQGFEQPAVQTTAARFPPELRPFPLNTATKTTTFPPGLGPFFGNANTNTKFPPGLGAGNTTNIFVNPWAGLPLAYPVQEVTTPLYPPGLQPMNNNTIARYAPGLEPIDGLRFDQINGPTRPPPGFEGYAGNHINPVNILPPGLRSYFNPNQKENDTNHPQVSGAYINPIMKPTNTTLYPPPGLAPVNSTHGSIRSDTYLTPTHPQGTNYPPGFGPENYLPQNPNPAPTVGINVNANETHIEVVTQIKPVRREFPVVNPAPVRRRQGAVVVGAGRVRAARRGRGGRGGAINSRVV